MQLRVEDLVVQSFKIDWGNDDRYPLDNFNFYERNPQPNLVKIPYHETSTFKPKQNCEYRVRIFVKDENKREIATKAFETYIKN